MQNSKLIITFWCNYSINFNGILLVISIELFDFFPFLKINKMYRDKSFLKYISSSLGILG